MPDRRTFLGATTGFFSIFFPQAFTKAKGDEVVKEGSIPSPQNLEVPLLQEGEGERIQEALDQLMKQPIVNPTDIELFLYVGPSQLLSSEVTFVKERRKLIVPVALSLKIMIGQPVEGYLAHLEVLEGKQPWRGRANDIRIIPAGMSTSVPSLSDVEYTPVRVVCF